MNDLDNFIKRINEKTGIDLTLFSLDGEFIVGDESIKEIPKNINGVLLDEKSGKTYFILKIKDKDLVAVISGASETEKKFAVLITEIAKNSFAKEIVSKNGFFRSLLYGESNYADINKYSVKYNIPSLPCFVMVISVPKGNIQDITNILLNYGDDKNDVIIETGERECALVKFCDKTSEEYRSQGEYAEYLYQSVIDESGITPSIAIGGKVNDLRELFNSYAQAQATAKFKQQSSVKGEIHSYKEYILLGILQDLPKYKLNDYLAILLDEKAKEIFSDEEMLITAEEFFNNSLNVSETSRNLYLHRNTLMYRLDKIEKATGLNIRKFPDAITFRLITYINQLVK